MVCVDDFILSDSNYNVVIGVIYQLSVHFFLKDLDPLNYFVGIYVFHTSIGLLLSKSKFVIF